ncbi:hypothetical protein SAMN05880574_101110 [Chryseobacterium sp. RU37D]|nr:hypothetical protein SAMN05880574_101110 [Chryseobacterium sp. RU37D]
MAKISIKNIKNNRVFFLNYSKIIVLSQIFKINAILSINIYKTISYKYKMINL